TSPVTPTRRSRLIANTASTIIWVASWTWKRSPTSGTNASATAPTSSNTRTGRGSGGMSCGSGAEQAARPPQQNQGHQRIDDHPGGLRHQDAAERVGEPDQHGAEKGALDRADAADHHHHEGDDQDVLTHPRVDRADRRRKHAGERSQRRADA